MEYPTFFDMFKKNDPISKNFSKLRWEKFDVTPKFNGIKVTAFDESENIIDIVHYIEYVRESDFHERNKLKRLKMKLRRVYTLITMILFDKYKRCLNCKHVMMAQLGGMDCGLSCFHKENKSRNFCNFKLWEIR